MFFSVRLKSFKTSLYTDLKHFSLFFTFTLDITYQLVYYSCAALVQTVRG